MSEALEKAARALLEHEFDDAVEPNDWTLADEDERGAARDRARAAITAFLSDLRATSEVELCRIADAYNASEPDFLVDEDELRWALSALMLHVADKGAHHDD